MKSFSFFIVLLAAGVLGAPLLQAQTPKTPAPAPVADSSKRISIEFEDAPIRDVADYLADQFQGANFVVPPRVAKIRVTLKLRNVTLDQALQALVFAAENRIEMNEVAEGVYGFRNVWEAPPEQTEKAICRIFSLALVPELSGDPGQNKFMAELENTIDGAIKLLRDNEPDSSVARPVLQFHPTTKLLVAVGKPADLSIVEQLVVALGGRTSRIPSPLDGVFGGNAPLGGNPAAPAGVPGAAAGARR